MAPRTARLLPLLTSGLLALAGCAALCLAFRYLPMGDVPQHSAMVSIMLHHGDPAWGFAQRYTFDFLGRPYATVYDKYYGDVTQQGIILDKYFAMQDFVVSTIDDAHAAFSDLGGDAIVAENLADQGTQPPGKSC